VGRNISIGGFLVLLLMSAPADAQIVNVLSFADSAAAGWGGGLTGGLDWRTGNQDLTAVRVNGAIGWRGESDHVFLLVRGEYGVRDEEVYLSRAFEHLRYRRRFLEVWAVEAYLQHETDVFRRMQIRALAGLGLRRSIGDWEAARFVIGSAWMPEYNLVEDESAGSVVQRWSNYATLELDLEQSVTASATVFAQPRFDDLGDVRVSLTAGIQARVGRFLVVPISLSLTHDSRPPAGVDALDTTVQSSVGFEL
jgi:hypothetical protein